MRARASPTRQGQDSSRRPYVHTPFSVFSRSLPATSGANEPRTRLAMSLDTTPPVADRTDAAMWAYDGRFGSPALFSGRNRRATLADIPGLSRKQASHASLRARRMGRHDLRIGCDNMQGAGEQHWEMRRESMPTYHCYETACMRVPAYSATPSTQ